MNERVACLIKLKRVRLIVVFAQHLQYKKVLFEKIITQLELGRLEQRSFLSFEE